MRDKILCMFFAFFRGHPIRTFMFGDYDFLTEMYGLSGAAGQFHITFCVKLVKLTQKVVKWMHLQ